MKSLSFKGKFLTLAKNSLKCNVLRTFSTSEDPTVTIELVYLNFKYIATLARS